MPNNPNLNPLSPPTIDLDAHTEALIENSPLREVNPNMADELLDRVNELMLAGTPAKVEEEGLDLKLIEFYRRQAQLWEIKQAEKPARQPRKPHAQAIEIDL